VVEVVNKLLVTSVLGFIAPGGQAQVVAGAGYTFLLLLVYQRARPYAEKAYDTIGYACTVEIFLFFFVALMLKTNVYVTADNEAFYSAFVGVLFCAVFVFPVLIIVRRLAWPMEESARPEEMESELIEELEPLTPRTPMLMSAEISLSSLNALRTAEDEPESHH